MRTHSTRLLKAISTILNIIWYFNIALMIIVAGFVSAGIYQGKGLQVSIPIAATHLQNTKLQPLLHSVFSVTIGQDQEMLTIQLAMTFWNILLISFFSITVEVLTVIIIYQLRKFFKAIELQTPFSFTNIRRLKITAFCFALLTVSHVLYGLSFKYIIENNVKNAENIHMVWTENFFGLALGVAIFVLADVFNYGFSLQKENGEFV